MLIFPQFNPVALQIGPVAVHWYGLAYVAAFLLGLSYSKYLANRHPGGGVTADKLESLFTYVILGVILGGRLGYVLFYNFSHYLEYPLDIFKVWQGGMSFHGGFLGVVFAIAWFAWKHQVNVVALADRIAPAVPIGLLLGRIANFINGELVGRITSPNLPWSMVFPHVDLYPRHPSQLYEAALEGLLLFIILFCVTRKDIPRFLPSGIFLTGYALSRILVESFRTPEIVHNLGIMQITQGQLLSLPMLALGLYFLHLAGQSRKTY
ncbi:MAG: prolipoprotein diacylglyceryl transferase [Pseudomonas fluorescens]|nr:MAG: prolipoprotein diacylglyceryl transferase [Pseudomonas fluorescens]